MIFDELEITYNKLSISNKTKTIKKSEILNIHISNDGESGNSLLIKTENEENNISLNFLDLPLNEFEELITNYQ